MKVTGSCHCGEISYTAEVDPSTARICHCHDCQKLSGGPYRANVLASAATFQLIQGKPKTYTRTAASGRRLVQGFCSTCASPIYAHAVGEIQFYGLRIGSLDQREELAPRSRIWCDSAVSWSQNLSQIPTKTQQ